MSARRIETDDWRLEETTEDGLIELSFRQVLITDRQEAAILKKYGNDCDPMEHRKPRWIRIRMIDEELEELRRVLAGWFGMGEA